MMMTQGPAPRRNTLRVQRPSLKSKDE